MAQQILRDFAGFVGRANQLDAALLRIVLNRSLAAAARVNLGFYDRQRAAHFFERRRGFLRRCGNLAAEDGDAAFSGTALWPGIREFSSIARCVSLRYTHPTREVSRAADYRR